MIYHIQQLLFTKEYGLLISKQYSFYLTKDCCQGYSTNIWDILWTVQGNISFIRSATFVIHLYQDINEHDLVENVWVI